MTQPPLPPWDTSRRNAVPMLPVSVENAPHPRPEINIARLRSVAVASFLVTAIVLFSAITILYSTNTGAAEMIDTFARRIAELIGVRRTPITHI